MIKRSKMDDAGYCMERAKQDLARLQKELRDIHVPMDLKLEVSEFLSFADIFFDNLLVDYMVQNKIAEARAQIDDAVFRVESILMDLRNLQNNPW